MITAPEAKALISAACEYGEGWTCAATRADGSNCCAWCKKQDCDLENEPWACLQYACGTLREKILASVALQEAWGVLQIEALRRRPLCGV